MATSVQTEKTETLVNSIVHDAATRAKLKTHGLVANLVTWEDTARDKGSCWGPNISDMTLCVETFVTNPRGFGYFRNKDMPVIRAPNFSDVTFDLPIDDIKLVVGNQPNGYKHTVTLREYLKNFEVYQDDIEDPTDLIDERDDKILASAQCCVLPCEEDSKTEFSVRLYNYQTTRDNPAVLVIIATKDGTSAQILDSKMSSLRFNNDGRATNLAIERLANVRTRRTGIKHKKVEDFREMKKDELEENVIRVFQVPLKIPKRRNAGLAGSAGFCSFGGGGYYAGAGGCAGGYESEKNYDSSSTEECGAAYDPFDSSDDDNDSASNGSDLDNYECKQRTRGCGSDSDEPEEVEEPERSGMDMGNISLGRDVGEFTGSRGRPLVRDNRFPIRCTYQCYRVTDLDTLTDKNVTNIKDQLDSFLTDATAIGSLVTDTTDRPTEPNLKGVVTVVTVDGNGQVRAHEE